MSLHESLQNMDQEQLIRSAVHILLHDWHQDDAAAYIAEYGIEYETLDSLRDIVCGTLKRTHDYTPEELRLINLGVVMSVLTLSDYAQIEKLELSSLDLEENPGL